MQQRISFITLGVADLQAMKTFYTEKFGWKPEVENDNIVFFKLNGLMLGLYGKEALADDAHTSMSADSLKSFTLAYNVSSEKEVDDLFAKLQNKGVKVIKVPEMAFWGGYSGYVADVEGNLWEIAYNPYLELDKLGNITGHKSIAELNH